MPEMMVVDDGKVINLVQTDLLLDISLDDKVDKLWDWESRPCTGGLKLVKVVGEKQVTFLDVDRTRLRVVVSLRLGPVAKRIKIAGAIGLLRSEEGRLERGRELVAVNICHCQIRINGCENV